MKTTYIYILIDPRDNQPKYVGKSVNPRCRLSQHTSKFHRTLCGNWLKSLSRLSLKPVMSVIDETTDENWEWLEQYWIEQFRAWGFPLKNIALGGYDMPVGYLKGISKTPEHRAKLSKTLKGIPHTEERNKNISVATSVALRQRNVRLQRELHQIDKVTHALIRTHRSIMDAHESTGIHRSSIANCLIDRAASAGGYVWKWVSLV